MIDDRAVARACGPVLRDLARDGLPTVAVRRVRWKADPAAVVIDVAGNQFRLRR